MIPGTFARDEREGVSYFIAEIQPDKYYGLFSLTDNDAADDLPAVMEFVGPDTASCLAVLKDYDKQSKAVKKNATTAAVAAKTDAPAPTDQPAARRPRKKAAV